MIIEFIGTPGAGKTTLLPTVVEHFGEHGITARSVVDAARPYAQRTVPGALVSRLAPSTLRRPLLWQVFYQLSTLYRLKFTVKHLDLIRYVQRSQKQRPIPIEERQHALYWFNHLIGYYEFLIDHIHPDEALLFDEGFVHRVVQMHASNIEEPDPARIAAYIDRLPQPDLVILPSAAWEVCEERIYRRGLWERFDHKSRPEVSHYVAHAHQIVSVATDYIKKNKGWTVIDVDNNSDDVAHAQAELRRKLTTIPTLARERPALRVAM